MSVRFNHDGTKISTDKSIKVWNVFCISTMISKGVSRSTKIDRGPE